MKKYIKLVSVAAVGLSLAGCYQIRAAIRGEDYAASSSAVVQQAKDLEKLNQSNFPQLSNEVAENEAEVKIKTNTGDITIKLFPEEAPLAVENFLTHAKEGYYDGTTFHRVIEDFMIQGGDPEGDGTGGESIWNGEDDSIDSGRGFKVEVSQYLYHIRGALAMANAGGDTNGSQFFIVQNTDDQSQILSDEIYPQKIIDAYKDGGYPTLDGYYTVFGQVIDGMDIVDKIAKVETTSTDKLENKPKKDITINSIEVIKDYKF